MHIMHAAILRLHCCCGARKRAGRVSPGVEFSHTAVGRPVLSADAADVRYTAALRLHFRLCLKV